ncbi:hypothetical protein NFIA_021190 [Paecilomyces variotii No. 5]|uniref:Vta1/callose synthase N-terminal domain-containing protein n=1 Tax=Byssochlamys spectabilis (strain No. 5 / NBRC 109023) TaxID=1356009 RepID=V5FVB3_BYSSN|nr:hypothetical protein NFIA_021190 [Paecilomyces variotii No. 5]
MAANIPAQLKSADLGRFALRAAQIEKANPVIAYWCNYWIVEQIIKKKLHTADKECEQYTMDIMDKLEQFKTENAGNDAITDNVAGQAYVEHFAMGVFDRAEAAMRADKVTKQTADTFQAAATFLELCQIWGPLEPEVAAKVKFAKYHAVRIVKAIKAGEDPNLTNPKVEEEKEDEQLEPLDPNDPEVKAIEGSGEPTTRPRQPSVEEVPDDADRAEKQLAQQSSLDESLHPSRSSSVPPQPPTSLPHVPSKLSDVDNVQPVSTGDAPELPSAPAGFGSSSLNLPDTPATSNLGATSSGPADGFESFPPPPLPTSGVPPATGNLPQPPSAFYGAPSSPSPPPAAPTTSSSRNPDPRSHHPSTIPAPATSRAPGTFANQSVDDDSIALAQKHARWAVSALSFDDLHNMAREIMIMSDPDGSTGSDIPARPPREKRRSHSKHRRHRSKTKDTTPETSDPADDPGLARLLQDLDEGVLGINSRMRDFTTFLDIKKGYHSEFLRSLWDYVKKNGYSQEKLRSDEKVRGDCAASFVDHFGQKYWGVNSQYLMEGSVNQPDNLCVYPGRKKVMERALTILLEKKASSREVSQNGFGHEEATTPLETTKKHRKKSHSKKEDTKRVSYRGRLTPELGSPGTEDSMELTLWKPDDSYTVTDSPDDPDTDAAGLAELESKYMNQTTFLLCTDAEQEMFPVHIPFHRFSRVSTFFASMMDECVLRENDDAMQVDGEVDLVDHIGRISAASVGFEWCGYRILIRPGKEQDWKRVIAKLREEWNLRDKGGRDAPSDGFNITVKLHLKRLR